MAIQPSLVQYNWSELRRKRVEVGRLYDDGFLLLKGDPGVWIQSSPDNVSSVRSLELFLKYYEGERIADSIGELSQLTHLYILGGRYLRCLPNTLSRLQNFHHLEFNGCYEQEELPPNLGDLYNLTYLSLEKFYNFKYVPSSIAKLSNLTTLSIFDCGELEELAANLGDLKFLASLFVVRCYRLRYLPWSITKISKLQHIYLHEKFILETLPPHLNDSIIISVEKTHIRKTWKELKTLIAEFPIIPEELAAQKTSTPGYLYLQITGDPTLWIRDYNYGFHSSLRVLDLDLCKNNIPISDSIWELPHLIHLYISNGCLQRHLPPTFKRLTNLSLIDCTFECDTVSHFDSFGKLSTLTSLHLYPGSGGELPEHMELPISLRHLSLSNFKSIPDSYVASITKLSNLNTLTLSCCDDLESLPLNLNLTKLILRNSIIKSLPIGLKHLEIIHNSNRCSDYQCGRPQECWRNQLVHLETLSYTCYVVKSLSSVTSLHNLRELQLKDCFHLKELPQDLDKLVNLCTLDVSGTRIQSLPNSILNLHNLRRLILPKCFKLKALPFDFENNNMISVDDTDESYYKLKGYDIPGLEIFDEEETSYDEYSINLNSTEEVTKIVAESRQEDIIEQASPYRPLDDIQILEGSHFIGSTDPTTNNNPNASITSPNHEIENLLTSNEAWRIPVVVNECHSDVNANKVQDHDPMEIEDCLLSEVNNAVGLNTSHAHAILGSQNQETEILQSNNCDGVMTSEPSLSLLETNSFGENNQHFFQNEHQMDQGLELQQDSRGHSLSYVFQDFPGCLETNSTHSDSESHYLETSSTQSGLGEDYLLSCFSETSSTQSGLGDDYLLSSFSETNSSQSDSRGDFRSYLFPDFRCLETNSAHSGSEEDYRFSLRYLESSSTQSGIPLNRGNNAVGENNSHAPAIFGSHNQETEILPSEIYWGDLWDDLLTSVSNVAPEPSFNLHETNLFGENSQQVFQNERIDNNSQSGGPQKKEIPLERINELMSKGSTVIAAAKDLGVSRSTLKRFLRKNHIKKWPRSKKEKNPDKNKNETHSTCERNSSHLNSVDHSNPASHNVGVEHLAGPSQLTFSSHVPPEHNVVNNSTPDVVTRTVEEPPLTTQYCMDSHQRVEEHPNGATEPALVNADLPPNERSSTFVVKATYNEDIVKFNFSLNSSIEKLKELVGTKLELEVGTFKIKYRDNDNDLVLMNDTSNLEEAVSLSRKSGSNVVRLLIFLKT